jgi:hypothetical protein
LHPLKHTRLDNLYLYLTMIKTTAQYKKAIGRIKLESLLEYVEKKISCAKTPQWDVESRELESSSHREHRACSRQQNDDDVREDALIQPTEKNVFEKVAERLVCCTNDTFRVTNNMDESFLEDDYYELVYRPSKRPVPLHNILSSTPSYDSGVVNSILSKISEIDERTVMSFDMHSRLSTIGRSPSKMQPRSMSWSNLICS